MYTQLKAARNGDGARDGKRRQKHYHCASSTVTSIVIETTAPPSPLPRHPIILHYDCVSFGIHRSASSVAAAEPSRARESTRLAIEYITSVHCSSHPQNHRKQAVAFSMCTYPHLLTFLQSHNSIFITIFSFVDGHENRRCDAIVATLRQPIAPPMAACAARFFLSTLLSHKITPSKLIVNKLNGVFPLPPITI